MKVSMDGLRRNMINGYNGLLREIKLNIKANEGAIEQNFIEDYVETLRMAIATLAYSYQEGEDGWKPLEDVTLETLDD